MSIRIRARPVIRRDATAQTCAAAKLAFAGTRSPRTTAALSRAQIRRACARVGALAAARDFHAPHRHRYADIEGTSARRAGRVPNRRPTRLRAWRGAGLQAKYDWRVHPFEQLPSSFTPGAADCHAHPRITPPAYPHFITRTGSRRTAPTESSRCSTRCPRHGAGFAYLRSGVAGKRELLPKCRRRPRRRDARKASRCSPNWADDGAERSEPLIAWPGGANSRARYTPTSWATLSVRTGWRARYSSATCSRATQRGHAGATTYVRPRWKPARKSSRYRWRRRWPICAGATATTRRAGAGARRISPSTSIGR